MSATAVRTAYVPRTSSLPPGSPNLPSSSKRSAFVPRTPSFTVSSPIPVSEDVKRSADAILKLISGLPAPIASSLPPTLLSKQSPRTPSSSSSFSSFKAYARAQKRKASNDESVNGNGHELGLGLGLSLHSSPNISSRPPLKKARTSDVVPDGVTPPSRSSLLPSPKARSSLRNEITRGEGKGNWSTEQWASLADDIGKRAHALKRLGDAYINPATAKGHLRNTVTQDKLRGVLLLTDSLCLYLYKNFADERANRGIVSTSSYMQLNGLRHFVLTRWNDSVANGEFKDHIKGMMGLIYLMEAITSDVIARTDMRSLNRMSKEVSNTSSVPGPSPSSSSASPGGNGRSPASSSHSELPTDLLKLVNVTYSASSGAQKALQQSRSYLSMRTLKTKFPDTYDRAINSDLADDMLSPPGDTLGCARNLEIDDPDNFAWPIELGMHNGVSHIAVFGRALVREFAQAAGKPWEAVLTDADSPQ